MPYTIWSRGRLIGETDLEFLRLVPDMRAGWFRPAPGAEEIMAELTVPTPAMLAFMQRDRAGGDGRHMDAAELRRTTLFADMAESLQRQEELELEVRRDDGVVVPTANVAIQDTERLRQLAIEEPPPLDLDEALPCMVLLDADLEADLEADLDDDLDLSTAWWQEEDDYLEERLVDHLREIAGERYQVYVTLVEENSIP